MSEKKYTMKISLNVLHHLGIGLYNNVPAVLSEVVANAWDADAEEVSIEIDPEEDRIVIVDDGNGMTEADINNRYLVVGYDKRKNEEEMTSKGRHIMGRKGIGKLSVFAIAEEIEVHSVKHGEQNALWMSRSAIEAQIKKEDETQGESGEEAVYGTYNPTDITDDVAFDFGRGTRLVLRKLDNKLNWTETYLRRRVARRFSVISPEEEFEVTINGTPVRPEDRDFYDRLEFIWYFGETGSSVLNRCGNVKESFEVDSTVDPEGEKGGPYEVEGWIGTVEKPENIDETNNAIAIFAHGKVAQEDILQDLKRPGIFAQYAIGEIYADFIDEDDDLITSDRQSLKQEDPRYEALSEFTDRVLYEVKNNWTELRLRHGAQRALEIPVVSEWYDRLPGSQRKYAKRLFGKIESLKIPDSESKKEVYRSGLLAFEKLALRDALQKVEKIETERDFELLGDLFASIDEFEAAQYYQIARGRLDVIEELDKANKPGRKQRAVREHVFDHLWLLDPSWERASTNPEVEDEFYSRAEEIERQSSSLRERETRVALKYRAAAGRHIIIDLRGYDAQLRVSELVDQVRPYNEALKEILQERASTNGQRGAVGPVEYVCVVGLPITPEHQQEENAQLLGTLNARTVTYDGLIEQSKRGYRRYLFKQKEVSELIGILEKLDEQLGQALPEMSRV